MKVNNVEVSAISIEGRAREDFGDVADLASSIEEHGLIHPIAVQKVGGDGQYRLLAGGRRLAAFKKLGRERIPASVIEEDIPELSAKSIELIENIKRKDMTYAEEVILKQAIHRLQVEKYGEKISTNPDAKGWSQSDTARLFGEGSSTTSRDLELAEAIEHVPELGKMKDKNEAYKFMKKARRSVYADTKAKKATEESSSLPEDKQRELLYNRYVLADFTTAEIDKGIYDLVEIDPPYGINLSGLKKKEGRKGLSTTGYTDVNAKEYEQFMDTVLQRAYSMLKPNGWLLLWFAPEPWFDTMVRLVKKNKFQLMAIPAIWAKESGQAMHPQMYLSNNYEMFFYARKGQPELQKQGRSNIFRFPVIAPSVKIHPTERPIEMMQEILTTFVQAGDHIAVPFLGSGNTILAAHNENISAIGWDISKDYRNEYVMRVAEGTLGRFASYTK